MKRFLFPLLVVALAPVAVQAEPQWIWLSKKAQDRERATFKTSFTVPGAVKSAQLEFTCDNGARAFLNGKPAGEAPDWQQPVKVDVAKLLTAGANELRFEAQNQTGVAALVARLNIEQTDGKILVVESTPEWLAAAAGSEEFTPAVSIAAYGAGAWGRIFDGGGKKAAAAKPGVAAEPATLEVAKGFKVELIYTVPRAEQGSWVSLTEDSRGRLIAGDQYGKLFRITVPAEGQTETKVEALPNEISGAHGLLYAFESLYVMVNETQIAVDGQKKPSGRPAGLWRLKYRANDDAFDEPVLLRKFQGSGEHGTHGLALAPDGQSIYFANGNHTQVPDPLEFARPVAIGEDHLLPRLWDANGHARGIVAPGGYVGKIDPEGQRLELFAGGFRNQYDIAFDANGELFTYDSDMEWDLGSPWYTPTRINHVVSSGDYGWRSGAGRWPDHYVDSLPTTVDIGPGSPTGTVFGTGAKFPAKYQRALFALDWTYATIWAIHLTPDGGSFRAEKEEFIGGKAFSVTDAVVRKADGALYVTIGGRGNQSALYRVTYTGSESTAPAAPLAVSPEAKLRHDLEKLHVEGASAEAVEKAWPHLGHADRFVRWAARAALEHQPVEQWEARALAEKNPVAALEALTALARLGRSAAAAAASAAAQKTPGISSGPVGDTLPGDTARQGQLLDALARFDLAKLDPTLRLGFLRVYELALTRYGKPAPAIRAQLAARLEPLFPSIEPLANRELVQLLVFCDSRSVVARTVPLLDTARDADVTIASDGLLARNSGYARAVDGLHTSRPNRQAIAYAYALRAARVGWTPELHKAYFGWFPHTAAWKGGNSFRKFLENIRTEALANTVPDLAARPALEALARQTPPPPAANLVIPKGPGKAYTVDEIVALASAGLRGRNFEQGKAMYASTLCVRCHHFGGEGGNVGPDLTGSGARYSLRDLAENIVEPSKIISDQYGTEQIEKKDGSLVIGRVVVEENGKLFVMTSALAPDALTAVESTEVKTRQPFNVSMMPPGLINSLNETELLDLLAYLTSAGNAQDKAFRP